MLKGSNNQDLEKDHIDCRFHLIFQRWKELTDKRTMSSYRYRIMNTPRVLRELHEVIGSRLSGVFSTNHSVEECRREAQSVIKNDIVLIRHYPIARNSLLEHLGKKADTTSHLNALLYQVMYSYHLIAPEYLKNAIAELDAAIEKGDAETITAISSTVVSCCIGNGWSPLALYVIIDQLKDASCTCDESWASIKERILTTTEISYCIYIPMQLRYKSKKIKRESAIAEVSQSLGTMGISVQTREELREANPGFRFERLPGKYFMVANVDAFDYYSACYRAIDRCADALNMLSFFNRIEPWTCEDLIYWVTKNDESIECRLRNDDLHATVDYAPSGTKVFSAAEYIFGASNSSISLKLKAAFAYANLGKASGSQEERFINAWVALESLCRGDAYDSIVSNVLETVPPTLCLRYIYSLFRNFVEDCLRCGIDPALPGDAGKLSGIRKPEERVRAMIAILKDSSSAQQLEVECSINDLLAYRFKEMFKLASDHTVVFGRVMQHCKTVRLQLGRMYRIRNSIAHMGTTSIDDLPLLTDHLTSYLFDFVSSIIMMASVTKEEKIEVIFEMLKADYYAFVNIAQSKKQADSEKVLSGFLSTGIISLIQQEPIG